MEGRAEEIPLKVCRHCSVASRTNSDECPSCGGSYERRSFRWRWGYVLPIVALAFAGGYFGLSELVYRYYAVVDTDNTVWEACYLAGRLEVSRPFELE